MDKKVIAIDFGTCNTYLSQSTPSGTAEEFNIAVGGDSQHGMKSVIMYRTAGEHAGENEFGTEAINAYGGASPKKKEANGLKLATSFKPDIEVSEQARKDSVTFLSNLLKEANSQNLHIDPNEVDVFIGVPSEATPNYRDVLRGIAKQAGWGNVRLLDEPFGALCSYQNETSEDAVKSMLNDSVLVVDFGGGTCDFVILEHGSIKCSWGDTLLGGRLFDDLFYQWAIDCTDEDESEESLMKKQKDFYWRCIKCRELKEKFSNAMVRDKSAPYEEFFMDAYDLEFSWDEFVRRAQNYKPSKSFLSMTAFPEDMSTSMFNLNGTTDILNWFEKELRRGFQIRNIPIQSIDRVLLAGGSSTWPFVQDACKQIFGADKLIRCTNVFAAISMGLVKYALIKEKALDKIKGLEQDAAVYIKNTTDSVLQMKLGTADLDSIRQMASLIFDKFAIPELNAFRQEGGSLLTLEEKLKQVLTKNITEIQGILAPWFQNIGTNINNKVQMDIQNWFTVHNINPEEFGCHNVQISLPAFNMGQMEGMSTDVGDEIGGIIAVTIAGAILAAILMGLAFTGPIGWAIGAAIAASAGRGGAAYVQRMEWSPEWAAWLVKPERIEKIKNDKFIPGFSKKFEDTFKNFLETNKEKIGEAIKAAINDALNLYRKVTIMEDGTTAGKDAPFSASSSAGDAFK